MCFFIVVTVLLKDFPFQWTMEDAFIFWLCTLSLFSCIVSLPLLTRYQSLSQNVLTFICLQGRKWDNHSRNKIVWTKSITLSLENLKGGALSGWRALLASLVLCHEQCMCQQEEKWPFLPVVVLHYQITSDWTLERIVFSIGPLLISLFFPNLCL